VSSEEENKEIALSIIEALNTRNLSLWSQHLAEDYTAEHPGVSVPLDKTRSIGYQGDQGDCLFMVVSALTS
jgi:hypothetical protein